MGEEAVSRLFRSELDRQRHHLFLPRLSEAGLAPKIIRMDDRERCLERCCPFNEWRAGRSKWEVDEMANAVVQLIEHVHALGVCHRGLHSSNLLVGTDGRPVVVDLELACEVDPARPCFDFYGPVSGVPIAEQHVQVGGDYAVNGVWWDSPIAGLAQVFGPLVTCLGRRAGSTAEERKARRIGSTG